MTIKANKRKKVVNKGFSEKGTARAEVTCRLCRAKKQHMKFNPYHKGVMTKRAVPHIDGQAILESIRSERRDTQSSSLAMEKMIPTEISIKTVYSVCRPNQPNRVKLPRFHLRFYRSFRKDKTG